MFSKKFSSKEGITLIALVVTIVVLIILATISINAVLGQNGIIAKAQEAKKTYEKSVEAEDTAMQELLNEMAQYEEGGTTAVKASDISKAADKSAYYGKTVSGYTCTNSAGVSAWQIFYADDSNIYLIASDYISSAYCPSSKTKSINVGITDYCLYMSDVVSDYQGLASVSTVGQSLNKSYFDYLTANSTTSTNNNMKAVAYMTDTNVWNVYAGPKAEYAIGGPTIEMLMKSYSQKYKVDYQAKATSATGYQISTDGGDNWTYYIEDSSKYLNTEDSQYVIKTTNKAYAMWLGSPSANDTNYVMLADYDGSVNNAYFNNARIGFRPLVCLQSDVQLVQGTDGNFTIK